MPPPYETGRGIKVIEPRRSGKARSGRRRGEEKTNLQHMVQREAGSCLFPDVLLVRYNLLR